MIEDTIKDLTASINSIGVLATRLNSLFGQQIDLLQRIEQRLGGLEAKTAALDDPTPTPAPTPVATAAPKARKTKPEPAPELSPTEVGQPPVQECPPAKDEVINAETVRALALKLIAADGNPVRFKAELAKLGAGTVSDLTPDTLPKLYAAVSALLQ